MRVRDVGIEWLRLSQQALRVFAILFISHCFFSYVLDQILSAEARDTIVENIAEYLGKGVNLIVNLL